MSPELARRRIMFVEQDFQAESSASVERVVTSTVGAQETNARTIECSRTPEQLLLRCRAAAKCGEWEDVEQTAREAIAIYAEEPAFHAQLAWSVHQQGHTSAALEIIDHATERFPRSVAVAFCAACLNGALERITEAKIWLQLSIELASNPDKVKLRSLVQPELQCLWNEPANSEWIGFPRV